MAKISFPGGGGISAASVGDAISKQMAFSNVPRLTCWLVDESGNLSTQGQATRVRGSYDFIPEEGDTILHDLVVSKSGRYYKVKTDTGTDLGDTMQGRRKSFYHYGDFVQSFALGAFHLGGESLGLGFHAPGYVVTDGELNRDILIKLKNQALVELGRITSLEGIDATKAVIESNFLGGHRETASGLTVYVLPGDHGITHYEFVHESDEDPEDPDLYSDVIHGELAPVSDEGITNCLFYDRRLKTLQGLNISDAPEHDFEVTLDLAAGISLFEN